MMRLTAPALAALVVLGLAAAPATAEDAAKTTTSKTAGKPVDIEADQMEIHDKDNKAIFRGNVIAKRPDVTLNTDLLNVDYAEVKQADGTSKNDVTHLEAAGHVIITTDKEKITGDWAKMNPKTNELEVGGSEVVVVQGQTTIRGPHLLANLDTHKMEMTGGRVRGSFLPSDKSATPGTAKSP